MKTKILKEYDSILAGEGKTLRILRMDIEEWIDRLGLCAIECVGKNEPEKIKGLFGEMVAVPENIIRNRFREYLREKLRQELFK